MCPGDTIMAVDDSGAEGRDETGRVAVSSAAVPQFPHSPVLQYHPEGLRFINA